MSGRESDNGLPGFKSLFSRGGGRPGAIRLSRRGEGSSGGAASGVAALSLSSPEAPTAPSHPSSPEQQQQQTVVGLATALPSQQQEQQQQEQPSGSIFVAELRSMSNTRLAKFTRLLDEPVVDLEALRELAWSGVPPGLRSLCWRLLLGYLPPGRERREGVLARRRREYRDLLPDYYDRAAAARSEEEEGALRQVAVDVPRTAPGVPFFHQPEARAWDWGVELAASAAGWARGIIQQVIKPADQSLHVWPQIQKSLERILYIWGLRHPASGYVQV